LPAERPLENAVPDHVALSVADLDAMTAFYARLGFDEVSRSDFSPTPVRTALLRNRAGTALELTAHGESAAAGPAPGTPADAARRRGLFHLALHVGGTRADGTRADGTRADGTSAGGPDAGGPGGLDRAVAGAVAAGAELLSGPASNSRADARFAYVRDPEGNLIELTGPA
jgi:catechol 2,3-dioxygenase-like lactoylglutathione lyase family enzyme